MAGEELAGRRLYAKPGNPPDYANPKYYLVTQDTDRLECELDEVTEEFVGRLDLRPYRRGEQQQALRMTVREFVGLGFAYMCMQHIGQRLYRKPRTPPGYLDNRYFLVKEYHGRYSTEYLLEQVGEDWVRILAHFHGMDALDRAKLSAYIP
ncbi:MAG: hypothetical protein K2Z81_14505 [Cyanobacteria bacterium]|nr:hypothetical protein [Cyanobacteriota bacterium]